MNDFDPLRETPRLPVVPFVAADVVLVGVAALIGWQAEAPLGVAPLAAISLLVGLGVIVGLYPFFQNHARRQEASLQERADQIEALARTLGATAEQVSIAVANLPAIAENSARQLKLAEQLPAAIHGQIAALQHQLSATAAEENAALRHELDTLRGAETDKLVTALADLGRLEALVARHATTLDVAISHLPRLADNVGERTAEAIRRETEVSLRSLRAAVAEASVALASATNETRAAFESSARDAVAHLSTRANSFPPFQVIVPEPPKPAVVVEPPAPAVSAVEPVVEEAVQAEPPAPELEAEQDAAPEPVAPGLMDDSGLDEPATPVVVSAPAVESVAPPEQEAAPAVEPEPVAIVPEPAPAPVAEPVVDDEPTPEPAAPATESATEPNPAPAAESDPSDSDSDAEPDPVATPDEDASSAEEPSATSALSHDGYTRLLVTAYIGIGNKLFIRGDGPGLRSDKGVALQFVSIGKWRWESAELLFPAKVRLYKNDQVECAALGELTLEPGHHHEVAAQF